MEELSILEIFDMVAIEGRKFTSEDFINSGLNLITNITEANIESAISIAKSAGSSQAVTAGILSGNISSLNKNMRKFLDHADAVIISPNNEYFARKMTEEISALITKSGFVNLDIYDVKEVLRNVGTVYFGKGIGKSVGAATIKASEMCGYISEANSVLLNITTGSEVALGELLEASRFIEKNISQDARIIWGHVIDDNMGGNVKVSVFAAMNDKNSSARSGTLSEVYNNLKNFS